MEVLTDQELGILAEAVLMNSGIPQSSVYHPEGDVFAHTLHVLHAGLEIAKREGLSEEDSYLLTTACWLHDLGKKNTTQVEEGVITSKGHAEKGAEFIRNTVHSECGPILAILVELHHSHLNLKSLRACRRMQAKLDAIRPNLLPLLILLVEADHSGRPPLPPSSPLYDALAALTEKEHVI